MTIQQVPQAAPVVASNGQVPVRLEPWQTLSLLIHAGSKIGKSTLAATAPYPILALDAEGGWKFMPIRQVHWDPWRENPPVYDGTWDVCVVSVRDWSTVERVSMWLTQAPTPFVSIVVDSISELQRRCKANLVGVDAMKIQDWGKLLSVMDSTIRGFRDLTLIPWSPVQCAVFVAESRQKDGKWKPYMQGQIEVALPYWMDIVGYMYPDWLGDTNGQQTQEVRQLLIGPNPIAEAGERVQGRLGQMITIPKPPDGQLPRPNIQDMLHHVYGIPITG